MKSRLVPAVLALTVLAAAGCSSDAEENEVSTGSSSSSPAAVSDDSAGGETSQIPEVKPLPDGAEIPEFDGPFAALAADAYRVSTSDKQREVLQDGKITDSELREMYEAVSACMTSQGAQDFEYGMDGRLSYSVPADIPEETMDAAERDCTRVHLGAVEIFAALDEQDYGLDEDLPEGITQDDILRVMAECLSENKVPEKLVAPGADKLDINDTVAEFGDETQAVPQCMQAKTVELVMDAM